MTQVVSSEGDWVVVRPEGELDIFSAPSLRDCLGELRVSGNRMVRLDLAAVNFMDSSGISVIVKAYRGASDGGGRLEVTGANETLRKLFEVLGLAFLLT